MGDVLHHIVEFARRTPDHDAVKDAESSLTYAELEDLAGRVAAAMGARGEIDMYLLHLLALYVNQNLFLMGKYHSANFHEE